MALIIGIVAVLIIIFGFLCYKKAPPTEAIVVTGFGLSKPKVVSGKGTFVLPVLQRADKLNMRLLKIDVKTPETGVKTQNGVSLWIDSVVTIQVYSENSTVLDDEVKASGLKDAKAYIMSRQQAAISNFLGMNEQGINDKVNDVLQGNLREIVSDMTVDQKSLVPQLGEDYILPQEVVTTCHLIARTRGTARPMTNVMLRGDPSVGKTAGARAIAAGLGLPYTFITCNAGTEMYNLIGDMMPVDSSASADSINEELFKDLPSATDISMDPAAAYEAITGSEKPDATEVECMTELFRKQMKLCADACNNGFKYVESPLVRAIRNGWVCELQEPSLITRPAVMPGLNGLLDETGCVVLPTGEMLHRHPDCIIISTLNIDLEGCRPLNQAFMDRHHIIMDMQCPTDDVIVKRIKGMTGCGDDVPLKEMVQCIHQIATVCARHGATDGNVNSMRSLANWVQAGMLIGDYVKAAEWTVVSGATSDPETRTELSRTIANHSF